LFFRALRTHGFKLFQFYQECIDLRGLRRGNVTLINQRAPLKIAFLRVSSVSVVLEASFIPHKLYFSVRYFLATTSKILIFRGTPKTDRNYKDI